MRITRLDSRSVLAFALVLGGTMLVVDLVAIVVLWIALVAMGITAAVGINVGFVTVVLLGLFVGIGHAAITAILAWLTASAFNLSTAWTGGLRIALEADPDEPAVVLPDTREATARHPRWLPAGFGAPPAAGVTSPSHSTSRSSVEGITVEHEHRG